MNPKSKNSPKRSRKSKNSPKRPRKLLSFQTKIDLIDEHFKNGLTAKSLSKKYGIGLQTVYDIIKGKDKILKYCKERTSVIGLEKRYTQKNAYNPRVDIATFKWFRQQRLNGIPISGKMIIEKAKSFHMELNVTSDCMYSRGWLAKFKTRHGIRKGLNKSDEIDSTLEMSDVDTTSEYCNDDESWRDVLSEEEVALTPNTSDESDSEYSDDEENSIKTTLFQAIEASDILLDFVENNKCPGITERDKIRLYRIQQRLLKEKIRQSAEQQKRIVLRNTRHHQQLHKLAIK